MKTYQTPQITDVGSFHEDTVGLPFLPYLEEALPFFDRDNP